MKGGSAIHTAYSQAASLVSCSAELALLTYTIDFLLTS
jgi:hypothetical protein